MLWLHQDPAAAGVSAAHQFDLMLLPETVNWWGLQETSETVQF